MSDAEVLRELKKISKTLLLVNAQTIERELSKVATTDERRRIWVEIDGKKTTAEIAAAVGVTQRSVQRFLKDAKLVELIDYQGDSVRRLLDYVPPSWIQLMQSADKGEQSTVPSPKPEERLDLKETSEMKEGS